jgi:hypothetical protein
MSPWTPLICLPLLLIATASAAQDAAAPVAPDALERGRALYLDGRLPSGRTITGRVRGDVELSGRQVICGTCHRRSGMGSSEGDQVIPAIAGDILFAPLRLPTASDPQAPTQRPAYTEASLRRAILSGIDANGRPLDALMPRYALDDEALEVLIGYLRGLSAAPSPGVDDTEIHFATIVAGDVAPAARQALVDVMEVFTAQKNAETRHESFRAENAPWHKKWKFSAYRKWAIHVWDLTGPADTWAAQLAAHARAQPVFAVISGVGEGSWQPVHDFCQAQQMPCLFPTTELPVVAESDFYPLYLSKGLRLDGALVARHGAEPAPGRPLVQVHLRGDARAEAAAAGLSAAAAGRLRRSLVWEDAATPPDAGFWAQVLAQAAGADLAVWMDAARLEALWPVLARADGVGRLYLSSTLFGLDGRSVPQALRDRVLLTRTSELPGRSDRLLRRSTGWLKMKQRYAPAYPEIQANAYLALKVVGDALTHNRGYFFRDYLIERIEHIIDSVPYTSVYPRITLAPGQRFAAKGGYIVRFSGQEPPALAAVSDWLVPR